MSAKEKDVIIHENLFPRNPSELTIWMRKLWASQGLQSDSIPPCPTVEIPKGSTAFYLPCHITVEKLHQLNPGMKILDQFHDHEYLKSLDLNPLNGWIMTEDCLQPCYQRELTQACKKALQYETFRAETARNIMITAIVSQGKEPMDLRSYLAFAIAIKNRLGRYPDYNSVSATRLFGCGTPQNGRTPLALFSSKGNFIMNGNIFDDTIIPGTGVRTQTPLRKEVIL